MNATELKTAKRLIENAIKVHMPSAAVASGWLSAVDPAAWVARVSRLFPFVDRPENMGLTPLTEWLAARGVEAGPAFVRALRHEWLMTRMAVESRRN